MSRSSTRFLGTGVALLLSILVLSGCTTDPVTERETGSTTRAPASTPETMTYGHATGADDVVVSVSETPNAAAPLDYNLRSTAQFLLLGDGSVIVPSVYGPGPSDGTPYSQPAIEPLQSDTISEEQIRSLLVAADDAGLLDGEIDYGVDSGLDGLPSTVVSLTIDGITYSQSAAALGSSDPANTSLGADQIAARAALTGFITVAQALAGAGSVPYIPTDVLVFRTDDREQPVMDPTGWAPVPWPIATLPPPVAANDVSSCASISGPEAAFLLDVLAVSYDLTQWSIGSEPRTFLTFRPMLPGDPGCTRDAAD